MLDLSTAVLCDFAQVRDRLLFVSSGAVSRLYRQELPSPLGLMVGLIIEVPLEDAGMEHRLRAEVINRHGTVLATLENLFRVSDAGLFPHEVQQVPLVLSITGVRARTWGTHQVRLYLDEDLVRALTLYVVPAAGPQAVVRTTPTQSRVADDEGSLGGTGTDGVDGDPTEAPTESPVPDGEPALEPVFASDDGESHEIVVDIDTGGEDDQVVTVVPDDGPTSAPFAWDAPAPTPEVVPEPDHVPEADDAPQAQPDASPEPQPEPEEPRPEPEAVWAREPAPAPWAGTATISAPLAEEPASERPEPEQPEPEQTEPATQVFDFDEDDLDADPADRPAAPEPEPSRFAFRYRYDDEDDTPG
jgi:hypothetical protein